MADELTKIKPVEFYALYDNDEQLFVHVSDYMELDMGSYSAYDGVLVSNQPFDEKDDIFEVLTGNFTVVQIRIEALEQYHTIITKGKN